MYDMASLHMLAIKTKTFRDLIDESPFTKKDVITIQVGARVDRLITGCRDQLLMLCTWILYGVSIVT